MTYYATILFITNLKLKIQVHCLFTNHYIKNYNRQPSYSKIFFVPKFKSNSNMIKVYVKNIFFKFIEFLRTLYANSIQDVFKVGKI